MPAPKNNKNHYKHGLSHTRIDNIYKAIISRCYNENNNRYSVYGEKGINVCNEWLSDKKKFFDWAFNNGYSENLTIDRIDPNGNYEPSNCRWVSCKVQANNKTNNRIIEFDGQSHTLAEWSDITGITVSTLWARLKRGWSVEDTLTKRIRVDVS